MWILNQLQLDYEKELNQVNLSKNRTPRKEIPLLNRGKQDQPEMFCACYRKQ